ncbi:endolytic transglycosylase MltG, partial [uncultured Muribaculum sp.]
PGPIRMPSARTLDALLKSKPHNYIYMCAKEDFSGLHNFASDFATHQKNAARYRKELDRRKIR